MLEKPSLVLRLFLQYESDPTDIKKKYVRSYRSMFLIDQQTVSCLILQTDTNLINTSVNRSLISTVRLHNCEDFLLLFVICDGEWGVFVFWTVGCEDVTLTNCEKVKIISSWIDIEDICWFHSVVRINITDYLPCAHRAPVTESFLWAVFVDSLCRLSVLSLDMMTHSEVSMLPPGSPRWWYRTWLTWRYVLFRRSCV